MSTNRAVSWAYAEGFLVEDQHAEAARARGESLGAVPVAAAVGGLLRTLAAAIGAHAVVEIGTGGGVSGLWLLAGMPSDGVLTTIDVDAEHQRAAKEAFAAAGVTHQRTRVITGRAQEVLSRMTDGAYDLVFVDGAKAEYPDYVAAATRLLRQGGVLVMDNMLWHDQVADPAVRDETTRTLRDLGKALRDGEDYLVSLLPVGDGVLVAVKR